MKTSILTFVFVVGLVSAYGQNNFRIDINALTTIGESSDESNFGVSADIAYLFKISDKISLGPSIGFYNYFGKDFTSNNDRIKGQDINLIPITASSQYNISNKFYAGLDLGFAIGLGSLYDAAFFFKPNIGYNITDKISGVLSYSHAADKTTNLGSVNLGIAFNF